MRTLAIAIALLLAPVASAAPIISVSSSTIALSPTQTVLTIEVDPFDTPLTGASLTFSSPDPDLVIVGVSAIDGDVSAFGPGLNLGVWQATLAGAFLPSRNSNIVMGTVTVEGFTPGTQLMMSGELTDSLGAPINVPAGVIATVVPEPGTLALLALGVAGLGAMGRRQR